MHSSHPATEPWDEAARIHHLIQTGAETALADLIDQLSRAYREVVEETNTLPRHQRARRQYLAGKAAGISIALNRARAVREAANTLT